MSKLEKDMERLDKKLYGTGRTKKGAWNLKNLMKEPSVRIARATGLENKAHDKAIRKEEREDRKARRGNYE